MKDVELWKDVKGVVQLEIVLAGPYGYSDGEGVLRLCHHPKGTDGWEVWLQVVQVAVGDRGRQPRLQGTLRGKAPLVGCRHTGDQG
jgi:hypothetical protein